MEVPHLLTERHQLRAVVAGEARVGADERLEHGGPPGEVELAVDLAWPRPAAPQVLEQLAEPRLPQAREQGGAPRRVEGALGITGEGGEPVVEELDRLAGQPLGADVRQGPAESRCRQPSSVSSACSASARPCGTRGQPPPRRPRLPPGELPLRGQQAAVQVGQVHPGPITSARARRRNARRAIQVLPAGPPSEAVAAMSSPSGCSNTVGSSTSRVSRTPTNRSSWRCQASGTLPASTRPAPAAMRAMAARAAARLVLAVRAADAETRAEGRPARPDARGDVGGNAGEGGVLRPARRTPDARRAARRDHRGGDRAPARRAHVDAPEDDLPSRPDDARLRDHALAHRRRQVLHAEVDGVGLDGRVRRSPAPAASVLSNCGLY